MTVVLHLMHTTGPGGAETVCYDVARGLDPGRWQSIVCVPEEGWITRELQTEGMRYVIVPLAKRLSFLRQLRQLIRRERIGLIHAHLLGSAFYGSLAGLVSDVPVVSTFHGLSDVDAPLRWAESLRYGVIRRGSHVVACVSEPLRDELIRRRGYPRSHTAVVVNGVDVRQYQPGGDRSFRSEMGIADDQILVAAIGNIRDAKDYPTLLRAAAQLSVNGDRYRFVVVGDDRWGLQQLLELRDALGLRERVVFTGFRPDVSRILRAADVFALSSSSEGFSLSTVQAMAAGVPVVATRCGGPEQILRHEQEGLLVPVSDPSALAEAIDRLRQEPGLGACLAARARDRVAAEFSTTAMVRQYEDLYEMALRSRNRGGRP